MNAAILKRLSVSPKHSVNHLKNKASRARAFTNHKRNYTIHFARGS